MSRLTANLSMTNELAEEYRELKRNLIPILLQICGKERLCDAVDKWLLIYKLEELKDIKFSTHETIL